MEWVVTTGKTIEDAKDLALDQLGVAADEAEFEIVEEPKTGLFGRLKGEARIRARVKPAQVRPKQDRRDRRRGKSKRDGRGRGNQERSGGSHGSSDTVDVGADTATSGQSSGNGGQQSAGLPSSETGEQQNASRSDSSGGQRRRSKRGQTQKENAAMHDDNQQESTVTPEEVGEAAVAFMTGLTEAFGAEASTTVDVDGTEIDVRVEGAELGLLVGPGGRTLTAVQDLARVASQRRLGDHETRLRIDVGGYREKRKAALEKFAVAVAHQVVETGQAKALEPMSSADRKAVHDAITEVDGVVSRSEGDDPNRRVVITPA